MLADRLQGRIIYPFLGTDAARYNMRGPVGTLLDRMGEGVWCGLCQWLVPRILFETFRGQGPAIAVADKPRWCACDNGKWINIFEDNCARANDRAFPDAAAFPDKDIRPQPTIFSKYRSDLIDGAVLLMLILGIGRD